MQNLSGDTILQKIQENRDQIQKFGVLRIGLFGSFARGDQRKDSDIDLLVEFTKEKKTFRNFIDFSEYIERVLGKKVEVLTPGSMSPHIAPSIKQEAKYVQI